ncbi:hypothetical protein ACTJKO_08745 [Curtobacterium sp. 22159]|uniref:hypothetical protein n=1 Tax=Curtobacterium sp. 22159 TaxID=3453882 RepID=UPI003F85553B
MTSATATSTTATNTTPTTDGSDASRSTRTGFLVTWVGAVVVAIVSTALLWYRLGPKTRGTAWAEDSGRFLNERLQLGEVPSLLHPYEGYLHLVPRIVVDLAVRFFPIESYAVAVSAMSCAVVGLVGAAVFVLARDVVRSAPLRALLAVVPALTPLVPVEIGGNTANLHWFLLMLAPWVFLTKPRSWWSSAVLTVIALLITLTEIQAAMFLPLFLRHVRSLRSLPPLVAGIVGAGAQLLTTVLYPRTPPGSGGSVGGLSDLFAGFAAQPVAGSWDADVRAIGLAVEDQGWWIVVVPAVVLYAVLVLAFVRASGGARWILAALAVSPLVVWFAALLLNHVMTNWLTFASINPYRYAAAASAILIAGVVVAADVFIGRGRIVFPALGWLLVLLVVAAAVLNVHTGTRRDDPGVPAWSTQVQQQRPACEANPDGTAVVRAAPGLPKWDALIPCVLVDGR